MNCKDLKLYISKGLSTRQIAKELNCSQSTVKYWLNKFNLKTDPNYFKKIPKAKQIKLCVYCGNDFPHKGIYCSKCKSKIRRARTKIALVKLMGGKCSKCGWDKHHSALEFHHISGDKKFGISSASQKSWEVVKKEVKKCILICSNCHRIEHSNYSDEIMMAVKKYKGRDLN